MKKNIIQRTLTAVLTIVALAVGQSASATTKTVTYTLSREKVGDYNFFALTHSGDTPFDGTTTVEHQQETNATQATFHLPDGFTFTFNWGSGATITSVGSGGSTSYFFCGNANVRFQLHWDIPHRYVTNVKVTDDQGNPSELNSSGTATTNYNYAEQDDASYTLKTYAHFVRLVITYSDAPGLSVFQSAGTNTYNIKSAADLRHLADYLNNGGNDCSGLTFFQTTDITCDNTYIPIAHRTSNTDEISFNGTYDGLGNTVSGITANYSDDYVGMFGYNTGTIRNVVLASSTFTGYSTVGGIVGRNDGTVENCRVESSVSINAARNGSSSHGGIAGENSGLVIGCISAATVSTLNDYTNSLANGGIVGYNKNGGVRNCLYTGTNVSVIKYKGAIVGFDENNKGAFTNNYYTNIDLGGVNGSDQNGARRARTVTLNEGVVLVGDETIYNYSGITAIGTGNYALSYSDGTTTTIYSAQYQTLSLSYDAAAIPDGYDVLLSITQTVSGDAVSFTDHGDHTYTISSMPAADITVSVTQIPVISYIDADGNPQNHACIPIVSDIHSYQTLGRTEGWYVVNSDVTDDYSWSSSFLDQAVHIILCDGKTFSRRTSKIGHDAIYIKNGSLSIYSQSLGTGRLMVYSKAHGIYAKEDICLNGGTVSSTSSDGAGIFSNNGDVTIHRGNITAQGGYYGIRSFSGTIILGCSSAADHITANSYEAKDGVIVANGQTLTDGISSNTFTGTLCTGQAAATAIAGKTLMKSLGDVAYLDGNGQAQTCSDYTILWDSTIPVDGSDEGSIGTADQDTWYVASTDYTFGKKLNALGHVHLILCDGATFTVNGTETGLNTKDLSIYGQSLGTGTITASATDKAMSVDGNLVINGGTTNATGGNYGIYVDGGYLAINGGTVNATGTNNGIYVGGNITLGWSRTSDRITASSYYCGGIFSVKNGQIHTDGSNNYSGTLNAVQIAALAGKTLQPVYALVLADNADNTTIIDAHNGETVNVVLTGRTLYKDGGWNTLCLPFNAELTGDLANATVMELNVTNKYKLDNSQWTMDNEAGTYQTGLANDGTLYLYFKPATSIVAGTPYIIKWDASDPDHIDNPIFTGVTIANEAPADHAVVSEDHKVSFIGNYDPVNFDANDKTKLFLGSGSTLYYPSDAMTVNAFRAYFSLTDPSTPVKSFVLNFGDERPTLVSLPSGREAAGAWYDLSGRRVTDSSSVTRHSSLPKGIYIHNGRKVVIK